VIEPFKSHEPVIAESAFIAPDAWIIGQVELAEDTSVFFSSVLRGDIMPIRVGRGANIQEHSMVHTSRGRTEALIGEYTTVGHRAVIHGCWVGARCLIGMGAVVLDDTVVEDECLIAAGTVITEGKRIASRSLVAGVPGKVIRTLGEEDIKAIRDNAEHYIQLGAYYRENLSKGAGAVLGA
jgi:carbonic anhydrase/acetyltransferase-like protein (isoleucine patch superfamily)